MQDDGAFYGIVVAITVVALAIIVIAGAVGIGVSVFSNWICPMLATLP